MVNSFIEYWSEVKRIRCSKADDEVLFFRGHARNEYLLQPGSFRQPEEERKGYRDIMVEFPEEFVSLGHLSRIVKMQHYGNITRLIDMTRNPLAALYFASEQSPNENGHVVVCKVKKSQILPHDSDKALMLACLAAFSVDEQEEIRRFCEEHRGVIYDGDIRFNTTMRRFMHEIRKELPAFATCIVGEDLLKSYFVSANKDNERMKIQSGVFVICGLDKNQLKEIDREAIKIEIAASAKKELLQDLRLVGIDSSTVYPNLERRAFMLRNKRAEWVDV